MKSKSILAILVVGVVIGSISGVPTQYPFTHASPAIIYVPDDYSNIQAAIDNANEGDTIIVRSDTYHEDIDIDKTLTIQGEDKETTIINGLGAYYIVYIDASDVIFSNFTVLNGSYGIYLDDADRSIISDCIIFNCTWDGVRGYGSTGISIIDCTIYETDSGIDFDCSCFTQILNTVCYNNYWRGIEFSDTDYIQIVNCTSYNNTYDGIRLSDSNVASICNTRIYENGDDGIDISGSEKFYVSGSSIYDNDYGTYFHYSEGVVVNCNFTGNDNGLFLWDSDSRIRYCSIDGNHIFGIYNWDSVIDATECWWGSASGPYHPTLNPTGTGDGVDDNVEFDPWQTSLHQPDALISDLRCQLTNQEWRVVYPDQVTPKPLGCGAAMVSDWLASAFVTTKIIDFVEGLDTNSTFVDQSTGEAVGDPGIGILSFGGPFVNPVVKRAEDDGTPEADRAPVKFHSEGDTFYFQYANGTNIPGAELPVSVINDNEDLFVIERYLDEDGRYMMLCYGFGWPGTYAAGKYFNNIVFPHLALFTEGWIVVKWEDTNGDGFVNDPGKGDNYTLIASGL